MNVGGMFLGKKVTKRYPRRGDLQLVRLGSAAEFTCSQCAQTMSARLVAVHADALFCNGCYGRVEAVGETVEENSSRAARQDEPSAPGSWDLSRIVVEERGWGLPYSVVNTDQTVEWKLCVRAEHLLSGTCPVPAGIVDRARSRSLNIALVPRNNLALVQGAKRVSVLDYQPGVTLQSDGDRQFLSGMSWHRFVLPGTLVAVRWDRRASTRLHFAYTRLRRPVVVAGTMARYTYDARIMTRDLAAVDVRADRVEELLLVTLRELGYLDERGRALLPQPALIRNASERAEPGQAPTSKIEKAIQRLLSRKLLTWEWGSLGAGGTLQYPARAGERPVELLCYTPTLCEVDREDPRAAGGNGANPAGTQRVAGHLMRIGHLGKEASPEARAAYRYDHQRAGLAGPHEVPRGYTYVREHERGV